jgi:hypothetical protein
VQRLGEHPWQNEERRVANVLTIDYTAYVHDGGRVKRLAEALTGCGDRVEVIWLASDRLGSSNRDNVIVVPMLRYRGSSRCGYAAQRLALLCKGVVDLSPARPPKALRHSRRPHDARRCRCPQFRPN